MAIYFLSGSPQGLLDAFKKAIRDGHVLTWSYDNDGDFTHTHTQWAGKAWLRPRVDLGQLTMRFLKQKNAAFDTALYGVFQGRFIESMISHCSASFSEGKASSRPTSDDIIG